MKKIIALLLALMMTFSVATVAFAEGESTEEDKTASDILGEYDWILEIPAGSIGPALKFAKFALKMVKVFVAICNAFGVDPKDTASAIVDYIAGILAGDEDIINNPYNPNLKIA